MHAHFQMNAGVSPATLMKKIYEDEEGALREAANKLGSLIEEALLISKSESERADSEKNRADQESKRARSLEFKADEQQKQLQQERLKVLNLEFEIENLKKASFIAPPKNERPVMSGQVRLLKAYEGVQGKYGQPAVVLELSDGSTRSNNWSEGFAERLAYAKSLEGRLITTDVWGPYDGRKWFKNIYVQTEDSR